MNEYGWWLKEPYKNDKQLQQVCNDFKYFLLITWKHLGLPKPTEMQYDVADFLQDEESTRIIMQAFRGFSKTWITSAFVCWNLLRNPQLKIMIVSATQDTATEVSTFIKQLIEGMPILNHLIPKPQQRSSALRFDVGPAIADKSPSVKIAGITGQITGSRADIIIGDDVEISKNSDTVTAREKLVKQVGEFSFILKPDDDARIIFLGTPQSEESIYKELTERGYRTRIWPCKYPSESEVQDYVGEVSPLILKKLDTGEEVVGNPLEERFDLQKLADVERETGKADFQMQMMLKTTLSDQEKFPLKLSDLIVADLDPERAPITIGWSNSQSRRLENLPTVGFKGDAFYEGVPSNDQTDYLKSLLVIDPSGRGVDETSYAVLKEVGGKLFLLKIGGLKGGYSPEVLTELAKIAATYKVQTVLTEANMGDGMFNALFQPVLNRIHPCTLEEVKHTSKQGHKEKRILSALEPVLGTHKLVVDRKVIHDDYNSVSTNKNRLFYQLTHLTSEKGCLKADDRVDVLAMGVTWFTESLMVDPERMAEFLRERELDELIGRRLGRQSENIVFL